MQNRTKIIGAAIDACAGTSGAADTPECLNVKWFPEAGLKFDQILRYSGTRHDFNKLSAYFTSLADASAESVRENRFPIIIGGDHSCAIGTWSGISSAYVHKQQTIGLIWCDAHMDAHTLEDSSSGNIHGMPVAVLLGEGTPEFTKIFCDYPKIKPENIILIGIRSFEVDEKKRLQRLGVKIYYAEEVNNRGFNTIFNEAWNKLSVSVDKIGLSLDLDGFDPVFAPGVGTPVTNGINFIDCCKELEKLDLSKIAGLEITEGNDYFDPSGKTMQCIVEIIKKVTKE